MIISHLHYRHIFRNDILTIKAVVLLTMWCGSIFNQIWYYYLYHVERWDGYPAKPGCGRVLRYPQAALPGRGRILL